VTPTNFILATAGHVDHGKSTLVHALTGNDPDRLPEEKARGITIELGFAHLELKAPNESEIFSIGVIDVPGHEDFVRKMISGAGAVDLALLVVAADDGWMPQTEEHLQILIYLGVPRLIVALTKTDLVEAPEAAENQIRDQLRETLFADAAIIRTTAASGRALTELRAQLAQEFAALKAQADIGKPRLHVDRAFSLHGIGTVVTGTVTGGRFRRGEAAVVQPARIATRIRSLQNHNRDVEELGPGTRGALNLADVTIASEGGVRRGDVITSPEFGGASLVMDVRLSRSARGRQTDAPVRHGANVRLHHGSGNFAARVFFQDDQILQAGESRYAELRLSTPIFAFAGDRFVLRDSSERQTLAGGIILDPDGETKRFRKAEQRQFLEKCLALPLEAVRFVQAQVERDHFVATKSLLVKSCFSPAAISEATRSLASQGKIVLRGEFAADAKWWRVAVETVLSAIDTEHKNHPENSGIELTRIRALFPGLTLPAFNALMADLADHEIEKTGELVRRKTHRPALPVHLQKAGEVMRNALAAKPFDPPSRRELTPDADAQQVLRFLIQTGEVLELTNEVVVFRQAFQEMREATIASIQKNGPASVSELRLAIGSSRRIVVPFLERLDRDGVTRRIGDRRELR
jgi:selenocysteine-specific elongation factor